MTSPALADPEEKAEEASDADEAEETPTPDADESGSGDYEMAMADQEQVGDPDGFFDGVDADPAGSGGDADADSFFDGKDSGSGGGDSDSSSSRSSTPEPGPVAERANATVGKLGVFGLEEGDGKKKLEKEFVELAETVGFGRFTERAMEKHLETTDLEDIDPVWGVLGAALILAAAIAYKRPDVDTDDIKAKVSDTFGSLPMLNTDE